MRKIIKAILWGTLILVPAATYGQGQPPIQSPRDAACRAEATRRVLDDSSGLDPYMLGQQIWTQCMNRMTRVKPAPRQVRRAKPIRRAQKKPRRRAR